MTELAKTIFTEDQHKALSAPIRPDRVSERKQGNQTLSYVEAVEVIRAANGIFGFGNWGYSVKDGPKVVAEGVRQYSGKDPVPWYLWQETITLFVRNELGELALTMDGVGASIQSGDGPEGAEMAVKAADTDALKRALKNYGSQFGLSLYDKEDVQNIEENYKEWRAREQAARRAKGNDPAPPTSEPPAPSGEPTAPVPAVSLREQAKAMAVREVPKEPEPESTGEDDWAAADEPAVKGGAGSPEAIAAWKATILFGSLGKDDIKLICNVDAKGIPTTVRQELKPYLEMSVDECKSYFKEHGLTGSIAGAMLETMMHIEEDTPNKRYPLAVLTEDHLIFYQKEMPGRTYIDLMYEAVEWGADKLREKAHHDRAVKWLEDNPRSEYEQFA